jgi:hypothetical protein
MIPLYDIFRIETDGSLAWCEAAVSFESAKHRIKVLAASAHAEYVVLSQKTGATMIVKPGNSQKPAPREKSHA